MQGRRERGIGVLAVLAQFILVVSLASVAANAKKEPKTYPEEGKIVATGLNEYMVSGQQKYTHTYTVVTDAKTYLLDCNNKPGLFSSKGEECGGTKKLQIGGAIHFRIEKGWAYIPVPKTDTSGPEEKLRVLSEALKLDAKTDKPLAAPEKSEAKPPQTQD